MQVIDANIILRFLTNDLPEQANQAASLLQKLEEGTERAWLPDLFLTDIIWVLEGYYQQPRTQIREWITTILSLPGLEFSNKEIALTALDLYVENKIDWSDAFTASQMLAGGIKEIISFDQHFDRVKGVTRIEP